MRFKLNMVRGGQCMESVVGGLRVPQPRTEAGGHLGVHRSSGPVDGGALAFLARWGTQRGTPALWA